MTAVTVTQRLRRWADAREQRNTPGGHGRAGTELLRQAADRVEYLEGKVEELEDELAWSVPLEQA